MVKIDKRKSIYELDEIYKYKSLIERSDRDTIKEIIYCDDEESNSLHDEFIKLVTMEVNHELNKEEFYELKDELIIDMKKNLEKNR